MILNLGRIIRETVLRYADYPAVINMERNRSFTFRQLHELTNKVSNLLTGRFGMKENSIYATILENDHMALLGMWLLKTPCTALWLGIRDSINEHLYQIDYVKPAIIFLETGLLDQYYHPLFQKGVKIICMDRPDSSMPGVYYFWDLLQDCSAAENDVEYVADDVYQHISLLRFTGGTTGKGKCAMYSLSNILSAACNASNYDEVFPDDHPRVIVSTPLTHAAGAMVLPVCFKGGVIITLNRPDIEAVCRAVEKEKAELIYTVPTVLYRMLDMKLPQKYDLSSLKTIRYGASPISPSKLKDLIKEFGNIFIQGYAATESWVPGTLLGKKDHIAVTEQGRKRLNSVGRAVPGVEICIVDEKGIEVPLNEKGEIWIRGPHTIQGYYKDQQQTSENFSSGGFWKSGDIGFMDNQGYLYLTDRKKDMIISGGFNIYATEVENCLNSHKAVKESAVVGVPHEDWGEAVHAEVVLKKKAQINEQELIDYCKNNISRYKAPKTITFVDELPLSSVGKILRRTVREKYLPDS